LASGILSAPLAPVDSCFYRLRIPFDIDTFERIAIASGNYHVPKTLVNTGIVPRVLAHSQIGR
jgi:hypothetical protein